MNFIEERTAIETRFSTEWGATSEVAYENVAFKIPCDEPWVRLNIYGGAGEYRALGCLKRYTGVIIVQIFIPSGSGTNKAREFADKVVGIFDSVSFGGSGADNIKCDVVSIDTMGTDKPFYRMNVSIPFQRDT